MIDFTELPEDGNAFEQLIREISLVIGLHPHWTGKGPDQGRDLILSETATGPLGKFERTWLAQCKHFAHSKKSVGRDDLRSVVDDCSQVNATAYLLVCSTQASSSLVTKLREIESASKIKVQIWDAVGIEKQLLDPRCFSLGQIFFPRSFSNIPWKLYNAGSPNHWTAHYKSYYLHLSSRIASRYPNLDQCAQIIEKTQFVKTGENEWLRPRAIFFNDKTFSYQAYIDYLVPVSQTPSLRPRDLDLVLKDSCGFAFDDGECYSVWWDVSLKHITPTSDQFDLDHYSYYEPFIGTYKYGGSRGEFLCNLTESNRYR
jgi:hypothetical protein